MSSRSVLGSGYSPALTADRSRVSSSAVHLRLSRAMTMKYAYDMIAVEGVPHNMSNVSNVKVDTKDGEKGEQYYTSSTYRGREV